jgi:outer membrane protein assembly factor BamB
MSRVFVLLLLSFSFVNFSHADWPRFKGPNGDDIVDADKQFNPDLTKWSKSWEINIGNGYSAVSIDGENAYCMGHDGDNTETLFCLETKTGKIVWKYEYAGPLLDKQHSGGPNATPTIEGDKIYILGKTGQAFCLNKKDGSVVWSQDLKKISTVKMPTWGYGGSPVIYKDILLFSCGKTVAVNKKTGALIWLSKDIEQGDLAYRAGYATPVVFTKGGVEYVTFFLGSGLEVLSLKDGSRVARYNVTSKYNMVASTPVIMDNGNSILLSWNPYSALLKFDGKSLKSAWKYKEATRSFQNNIVKDGVIYGTHGHFRDKRTKLHALNATTGKVLWEEKFKWSQMIAVGDTLVCQNIDGQLVTVKMNSSKFEQISSIKVLGDICWTKPTYSNGRLYVRNNLGKLICFAVN